MVFKINGLGRDGEAERLTQDRENYTQVERNVKNNTKLCNI